MLVVLVALVWVGGQPCSNFLAFTAMLLIIQAPRLRIAVLTVKVFLKGHALHMYIDSCVHVSMSMPTICICMGKCMYMYIYLYIYIYMYMPVHVHMHVCLDEKICVHACMYTCAKLLCVCIYAYIHIHVNSCNLHSSLLWLRADLMPWSSYHERPGGGLPLSKAMSALVLASISRL